MGHIYIYWFSKSKGTRRDIYEYCMKIYKKKNNASFEFTALDF